MPTLPEILTTRGVTTAGSEHHHVSNGWLGADCPDCSPGSGRFRLGWELATLRCNCWSCGPRNPIAAAAAVCRITYAQAAAELGDVAKRRETAPAAHHGRLRLPNGIAAMQPVHRRYLAARGLDADAIARLWGVEGIGLASWWRWRLFIPIRDAYGTMVSWTTRAVGKSERRYINAPADDEAEPASQLLYGADLAREAIVIVEGPVDAWAIGPGAVATCGVGYSSAQMLLMTRYPVRAVCFDAEPAAQRRAARLCRDLGAAPGKTINIQLQTGSDPADADPAEIAEIRTAILDD